MTENTFDLIVYFKIETNKSKEIVTNILNLSPTPFSFKGGTNVIGEIKDNIWIVREKFENCKEVGTGIKQFFEKRPTIVKKIKELKRYGQCSVILSVVSLYAQIGFVLSDKDLNLFNELGVNVEVSVFSWGGCVDEE